VLTGALLVVQWAAAVILIVVLTFFFIKDGTQLRDWTVELFAEERRQVLREILDRAWSALATYVQGVFLVATIDAVLIGIVLLIVGVPIALPLIVLTFLAAFFPIVGSVLAGAAATLVALVSGGVVDAAIVLAAIIAIQQLEGNVFYPMIVGKRLQLHPVAILLALTAGGVLAGVAGAFLAIPVAAVVSAVLDYTRQRRRERGSELIATP
jgi:predicted PurR-regulated permease PerM